MTVLATLPADSSPRRSQAERTATMRARLIDAAIDCLDRLGYSATTLATIAEAAGVSRGGMLHQFPTKVDLMLAVVAFASGHDERAEGPKPVPPGTDLRQHFIDRTDRVWAVQTHPPLIAKLEIMMAARSDRVLAEKLPAIFEEIESARRESMWALGQEIGIKDRATLEDMVTLHMSAMRGLAIEWQVTGDRSRVDRAYGLLKHYKTLLTDQLLTQAGL